VTCQERRDQIFLYAADLDALEPAERDELRAHLASGCPNCAGALAEAEAIMAQVPQALDPVTPSPQARDRLMQRVLVTPKGSSSSLKMPETTTNSWWRLAATALVLIIIGLSALLAVERNERQREARALEIALADRNTQVSDLQAMLGSAQLKLIGLESQATKKGGGRVLWDADRKMWHVYVFDMAPPPPDKVYELWFITGDKKIAAGEVKVNREGRGLMSVEVPSSIVPIAAAITDEPANDVRKYEPQGQIQLVGKAL
jgi:hypothetical protein